ncbi:glycoside hydrolase family 10 protein [Synechococcus sp. RSCCF101]|nr:glycoside hydrolase family 10 protein [Synechococcus sp. RSCCF101]
MALAVPHPGSGAASREPEIRGVWLTLNDMATLRDRERMREAVRQLRALNFNTLYPVVWNGGYAYYRSDITRRMGLQSFSFRGLQGQDVLEELIEEAHAQGLLVIPWFEFGFMAPPTSELAVKQADWLTRKRDGGLTSVSAAGEVVWLNPFRSEVQRFIRDLVLEVVQRYDGDGIQFDDHMSLPRAFGYDPQTLALYKAATGRSDPGNPENPAWVKWRADRLTAFMASLKQELETTRPGLRLSVSPNYHDFAYKLQLQDWLTWVRRGIADEVIVQLYRPDQASFEKELARPELATSAARIPTAVGVMSGQRGRGVPIQLVADQTRALRSRGLGVAYFYFESLWQRSPEDPGLRKQALLRLFPRPALRPRRVQARAPAPPPPPLPAGAPVSSPAGRPRLVPPPLLP